MEKQKLIYVESKALFSPSSVSNKAIVFIKDTKEIWTHGTYFICSNIWATPITLTLSGDSTGSVSIDGSKGVTLSVTNQLLHCVHGSIKDANSALSSTYKMRIFSEFAPSFSNGFPASNYANAIININTHSQNYDHQLGFSSNKGIYHRTRNAGNWETSWEKLLTSTNYTSFPHTFASLTNKPTTISGYGITDSIPIIKGGEVTANTDLSTLGMTTAGYKFSVSYGYESYPSWLTAYTNLFIFRANSDFYSGIATGLPTGLVTFLGGRYAETSKNNVPNWWYRIKGNSGTTYDLNSFLNAINNLDSNYLRKSGGTMTGILTLTTGSAYINDTASGYSIYGSMEASNTSIGTNGLATIFSGAPTLNMVLRTSGDNLYHYNHSKSARYKILDANNYTTYALPLTGGTLTDTLILKAGAFTASNSNSYSGGRYQAVSKPNIRLIGDSTYGLSTIEFTSQKGDTSINKPSDSGFIQFLPYGVSALSSIGSHPTLKTSGESNALVLGVTNDSDDIIVLQSPNISGLRHACGATEYYLPHITTSTTTANKPLVSTTTAHVYTLGDEYLPLKGGTMTGLITLWASNADAANTGGLNANNSNIYGLNSLYFADASETAAEGINFYRSSTTVDSLWGSNGNLFWTPNRTYGLAGTNYYVLTSNNYSTHLNKTYLPLSGGTMTGLILMTRGSSYLIDTGYSYGMLGMTNSGGTATGMNSEEGMYINVPFTLATLRTSGNNLWHYNHANSARYLILDTNNYTNYTIPYAKANSVTGVMPIINNGNLWYHNNIRFLYFTPDDNHGAASYLLIAELTNYGTGANTSYVNYGLVGTIYGYRGGNMANTHAYNISVGASIGPATSTRVYTSAITDALIPMIVKYDGKYYIALLKSGSSTGHYFIGLAINLLSSYITVNDSSLIEIIKKPSGEVSTGVKYYNNGDPKYYLHEGNYSNYALPLSGGTLTGTLTSSSIVPRTSVTYNIGTTSAYYNNIYALYFKRKDSSDSYVLLGGGGHKLLSELSIGSADKLNTTRYFWGRGFNGTLNVNGQINIVRNSEFASYNEGIRILASSTEWAGIFLGTDGTDKGYITSLWNISKTNSDSLRISRGATSNYLLDIISNGNIGIGTTSPSEKLEVSGNAIIGTDSAHGNITIKSKTLLGVAYLNFDNGYYATGDEWWKGYIAVSGWGDTTMRTEGNGLPGENLVIHGMIFKLPRIDIGDFAFRNGRDQDVARISTWGVIVAKAGFKVSGGTSSQFLKADGSLDSSSYLKTDGSNGTSDGVSTLLNKLTVGSVNPQDADYYICQYAGGSTATTTYHRRPTSALYSYIKSKLTTDKFVENSLYEANLKWGGGNKRNSFGPLDAALIDVLGANRMAFANPNGIEILYSRDGGETWIDYEVSDSGKTGLFTTSTTLYLGKASTADLNSSDNQLRVIITSNLVNLYTELKKFAIFISDVQNATTCTIEGLTRANIDAGSDTWTMLADSVGIGGNSGWSIINCSCVFGNNFSNLYNKLRFTFKQTAYSGGSVRSAAIQKLYAYGGMGWTTPSTLAANGHLYSYNNSKEATFPAKVTATSFSGPLTGNVTGNVTGTATSANKLNTNAGNSTTPVYFSNGVPVACTDYGSASVNKANLLACTDKRNSYPALIVTSGGNIGAAFIHKSMLGGAEGTWYDAIVLRGYVDDSAGNENALLFSKNTSSVYHSQYAFGSTTTWGTLYKFLDSGNYKNYAPTLSGEGATGTWGINISGTANKVANALTLLLNGGTTSGTNKFVYDGSAAYTVNITPDAIGAAASSHTHSYLPLEGGTMSANGYIAFPASANSSALGNSTPMGITYGRIHSYGTLTIAGDTDASKTEFVNIVAGRNISQATAANGLSIGYNTLKWQGTDISLAGHNHDGSYLKLSGGTLGSNSASVTELRTLSSTAALRIMSYSDSTNYILSGNSSFDGNATLRITGYSNVTGTNLYFKFNNIYCRGNDYINIDSGNYGSYALPLSGGTMTGAINTANIYPKSNAGFNIGSTSSYYNTMYAYYFKKYGSDDNYLLLGGGGHKKISDFPLILDKGIEGGNGGNTDNWVLVLNNNYSTGWYGPCTMFYIRSKNFGCGILCFYHYWNTEGTSGYYDNSVWFFGAEHSAYSVTMGGIGRDINNYLKVYIDKLNADLKIYYNRYNNLALNVQELLFVHGPSGTLYPSGELRASHFINSTQAVELPTTSNTFVNIPILTVKNHTEDIKTTRSVYASAFYENSDIRLKENVHSIDLIDLLKNVDLVLFNFKNDLNKKYGVIAQQLEQVGLNNLVYEHNGNKAVDYISLLVLETLRLRNEIKELKEKLDKKELSS